MKTFGSAVILCGGKSSRMGFDKSNIMIKDQPIFEHIAEQLELCFDEVILVTGKSNPVTSHKYRVVEDLVDSCGPIGGILTGLSAAESEFVFFTACDMPFVDQELIAKVINALKASVSQSDNAPQEGRLPNCDGAAALNNGFIEPFFGFYSKHLIKAIQQRIESGQYQINQLIRHSNFLLLEESFWKSSGSQLQDSKNIFSNLNYERDIDLIRQTYGEDQIRIVQIVKYTGQSGQCRSDKVVREQLLHVYVNGRHYTSMNYTPGDEENLVVGFLLSQGIINQKVDILSLERYNEQIIKVMIALEAVEKISEKMAFSSGCGSGKSRMSLYEKEAINSLENDRKFKYQWVSANMKDFNNRSQLFRDTGGVHSCALYRGEELIVMKEDIGRHNAADKAIGQCFLDEVPLEDLMLLTTGRVSSDILLKMLSAGIPLLVSHSAPTDMAVQMAEWGNITLLGFVRGDRMNVYSGFERLID